ncbi:hypothetical protein Aduo_017607 [Ancylostoma duodenale]
MDNIRAYGAGLAGGQFDANAFFKKPTVIFRTIALVHESNILLNMLPILGARIIVENPVYTPTHLSWI